jgi:adenine-specific DNA-methyltransferase
MGSKAAMLRNGLGEAIVDCSGEAARIVDLFTGSAAIARFAARGIALPVLAIDLQLYAVVLARAVVERDSAIDFDELNESWIHRSQRSLRSTGLWRNAATRIAAPYLQRDVLAARKLCAEEPGGLVWSAYGGHYFSPRQAAALDHLLSFAPSTEPDRSVALAAIVAAASRCAAAPGHTAQPFRPTRSALPFINAAWQYDLVEVTRSFLRELCAQHAITRGEAVVGDAIAWAGRLNSDDLVVLDPPYSAVQYSRFYHVLETIVRGQVGTIFGSGRYPPVDERPTSDFSLRTQSARALDELLATLSVTGCQVILTYPDGESSNGLSGTLVVETATRHFSVVKTKVTTRFSTLGGNGSTRAARHRADELIITMRPR